MESYILPSFPTAHSSIHISLFHNVCNSAVLRQRLVAAAGMPDNEDGRAERELMDYGFVDASMLVSKEHLLVAIYQALLAASSNTLKTKTLHSEVLLCLYPTNNITEAIKRFGISPTTTSLVLLRIGPPPPASSSESPESSAQNRILQEQRIADSMDALVEGDIVPLDQIGSSTDWVKIKKVYKLNDVTLSSEVKQKKIKPAWTEGGAKGDLELLRGVVVSTVGSRSVAA